MLFISFNGWKNIGNSKRPCVLAHFTTASTRKNPRGTYNAIALKEMLKNPPPAFQQSDKELVERALKEAPVLKR